MPYQRRPSAAASVLAAAGAVLAVAGCTHITPLGPPPAPPPSATTAHSALGPPQPVILQTPFHLRSPFVLAAVRVQRRTRAGRCPAGAVALYGSPHWCSRKLGKPVTITSAAISADSSDAPGGQYGFVIALRRADQPRLMTITTTAADAHAYLSMTVAGRTWLLAKVLQPFAGPLEIAFSSRTQTRQLYRLLVSPG